MNDRARTEMARRIRRWALLITIIGVTTSSGHARAQAPVLPSARTVPGQALVRFEPGTTGTLRTLAHARAGAELIRRIPVIGYDLVRFPTGWPLDAVLASYRSDPFVVTAQPNHTGSIALSPADACHAEPCASPGQWHLRMTNTPFGWDAFPGTTYTQADKRTFEPVTIAVLDTKIDASHPDWINAGGSSPDAAHGGQLVLADARDWVPPSNQSGAALYHGTFVAGLAAASANGADTVGVGYAARVLPLTVVDGSGMTNAADLADAIVYAWRHDARVINLSLGIVGDAAAVQDAIQTVTAGTASRPPSLVVAAAGNNTGSAPFYPGSYAQSMSVAGTDADDRPAPCSNHNANVSVSAPADRLVGLAHMPGRMMRAVCGTSAATPQVSGLAALLFAQDPTRTPAQVRRIIERSADDLGAPGRDDRFGHGRINIERALHRDGPVATGATGTVVPGSGGTSTITAIATSARGVRAAHVIFDRPDAAPVTMKPADGSFGGTTEALQATVAVPAGTAAGPHAIWVRAFDGETWGATTVGVVAVDARAPTISSAAVSGGPRLTGEPIRVTFTVTDDYSKTFAHGIEIRSTATNAIAYRAITEQTIAGGQIYEWLPGLEVPGGHYTVKIAVADQAGNVSTTQIGAIIT